MFSSAISLDSRVPCACCANYICGLANCTEQWKPGRRAQEQQHGTAWKSKVAESCSSGEVTLYQQDPTSLIVLISLLHAFATALESLKILKYRERDRSSQSDCEQFALRGVLQLFELLLICMRQLTSPAHWFLTRQ